MLAQPRYGNMDDKNPPQPQNPRAQLGVQGLGLGADVPSGVRAFQMQAPLGLGPIGSPSKLLDRIQKSDMSKRIKSFYNRTIETYTKQSGFTIVKYNPEIHWAPLLQLLRQAYANPNIIDYYVGDQNMAEYELAVPKSNIGLAPEMLSSPKKPDKTTRIFLAQTLVPIEVKAWKATEKIKGLSMFNTGPAYGAFSSSILGLIVIKNGIMFDVDMSLFMVLRDMSATVFTALFYSSLLKADEMTERTNPNLEDLVRFGYQLNNVNENQAEGDRLYNELSYLSNKIVITKLKKASTIDKSTEDTLVYFTRCLPNDKPNIGFIKPRDNKMIGPEVFLVALYRNKGQRLGLFCGTDPLKNYTGAPFADLTNATDKLQCNTKFSDSYDYKSLGPDFKSGDVDLYKNAIKLVGQETGVQYDPDNYSKIKEEPAGLFSSDLKGHISNAYDSIDTLKNQAQKYSQSTITLRQFLALVYPTYEKDQKLRTSQYQMAFAKYTNFGKNEADLVNMPNYMLDKIRTIYTLEKYKALALLNLIRTHNPVQFATEYLSDLPIYKEFFDYTRDAQKRRDSAAEDNNLDIVKTLEYFDNLLHERQINARMARARPLAAAPRQPGPDAQSFAAAQAADQAAAQSLAVLSQGPSRPLAAIQSSQQLQPMKEPEIAGRKRPRIDLKSAGYDDYIKFDEPLKQDHHEALSNFDTNCLWLGQQVNVQENIKVFLDYLKAHSFKKYALKEVARRICEVTGEDPTKLDTLNENELIKYIKLNFKCEHLPFLCESLILSNNPKVINNLNAKEVKQLCGWYGIDTTYYTGRAASKRHMDTALNNVVKLRSHPHYLRDVSNYRLVKK